MKNLLGKISNVLQAERAKALITFLLVLSLAHFWSSGYRDVLVWGSFLAILALILLKKITLRINIILVTVALYILWTLISSLYSVKPSISLREWIKLAELAAAAFVVAQLLRSRTSIDRVLMFVVVALTLIYIYDIAVYLEGLGDKWRWGKRWNDRWGELLHYNAPNLYSALIVAVFPLTYYFLSRKPHCVVIIACVFHFCAGLFLLYIFASRGAQTALAGMIILRVILLRGWKKRAAGIAFILVVAGLIVVLNPRFRDATMKNLFLRAENWRNTFKLVRERPLLGYGYGNEIYKDVYHSEYPKSLIPFKHAHNLMLKVAFESGIIGLIAYLPVWIAALWSILRIYLSKDDRFRSLALTLLLVFCGLFIYFLSSIPNGINRCYFWTMIGVTAAVASIHKKYRREIAPEQKIR